MVKKTTTRWFVAFQLKSVSFPPPTNGSIANGTCGTKNQSISISYSSKHTSVSDMSITLIFTMDDNSKYHMSSFLLEAVINKVHLNGWFLMQFVDC